MSIEETGRDYLMVFYFCLFLCFVFLWNNERTEGGGNGEQKVQCSVELWYLLITAENLSPPAYYLKIDI